VLRAGTVLIRLVTGGGLIEIKASSICASREPGQSRQHNGEMLEIRHLWMR
jgi:hypothetical protein